MKITQVFNNNVVLVCTDEGEMVVLGTGIGFKKKAGEVIDEKLIKKKFVLEKKQQFQEIARLFDQLSLEEIDVVFDIVNDAKKRLSLKIGDSVYPALADHIHYVIQRAKSKLSIKNPLSTEIKYLYPSEYKTCVNYVHLLNETFQIDLNEDEACSIVLHFLNAEQSDKTFEQTMQETKIIKDIVDIVRMFYGIEFKEDAFSYRRFIIHLHYFAKRILQHETVISTDGSLIDLIKTNYQKAFECVERIAVYLQNTCQYKISNDEFVYLTIHVKKITEE